MDSGAQWSIDSGTTWYDSGVTLSDLSAGDYTLTFSRIAGWRKPIDRTITIAAGETKIVTGTYRIAQGNGMLTVSIEPTQAVDAGAQWSLDGGAWKNSGDMIMNVDAGDHEIQFKPIEGWITPDILSLDMADGAVESMTAIYIEEILSSGDADGNGVVDIFDALAVAEYDVKIQTSLPGLYVADVDGDGVVDIDDALMIAKYDAGLLDALCGLRQPYDEDIEAFWDRFDWEELCPPEQTLWGVLGWNEANWNEDDPTVPASESKRWAELTNEEQDAATQLGYDEASWNATAP
jgi:hypothetical protein